MLTDSKRLMGIAVDTAREASAVAMQGFRKPLKISTKRDLHDMVTAYDVATEERIRELLLAHEPGSRIIGEEGGATGDEGKLAWYVDPIDGTSNFARGIAMWCVSIAVALDGRIVAAAVYEPVSNLMFHADAGAAFLNGQPIRAEGATRPEEATLIAHYPMPWDLAGDTGPVLAAYEDLVRRYAAVRNLGSSALSLSHVAAGWADATLCLGIKPWDVAAASFILKQAGGRYRGFHAGEPVDGPQDYLQKHYLGTVEGAQFPEIERILRRGSALLDQKGDDAVAQTATASGGER